MSRLIFASVLAGIAVFLWGFISHAVSPLGEAGLRSLPDEARLLDAMRATIPDKGLYFSPVLQTSAIYRRTNNARGPTRSKPGRTVCCCSIQRGMNRCRYGR